MHIKGRNVNDIFRRLVSGIHSGEIPTVKRNSRNGLVLQIPEPVILTYSSPREKVLFNQARDCNPFMHVVEALWMLAGRNDVGPIAYYAPQMKEYSDDGKTLNGAYGYRWRRAAQFGLGTMANPIQYVDQLAVLIDHLKRNPESRRAVLQMWNVEDDLLKIDTSRDICCNLSVMFSLRVIGGTVADEVGQYIRVLDMTVTNRSNDMIWGALGANACHFAFLQEYVAACLGVEVGVYNQFSNNLHIYTESNSGWKPEEWLAEPVEQFWRLADRDDDSDPYPGKPFALVKDPETFDRECAAFIDYDWSHLSPISILSEPFLAQVAEPMCRAFYMHKNRDYEAALYWIDRVAADDWRIAGKCWILKRKENYERKNEASKTRAS